jgi:hypothetical protein
MEKMPLDFEEHEEREYWIDILDYREEDDE